MGKIKQQKAEQGKRIKYHDDDEKYPIIEHPVFCFKYLHKDYNLEKCQTEEKVALIEKLYKLSQLNWIEIQHSNRHGMGSEKIDQNSIRVSLPTHITKDVSFLAIRFSGMKPMIGYRNGIVFHIIYLDRDFTVYKH